MNTRLQTHITDLIIGCNYEMLSKIGNTVQNVHQKIKYEQTAVWILIGSFLF